MLRTILFCVVLLTCISCKKDKHAVTISGKLLVSSSNPVPVSNYTLSFYQKGSTAELIALGTFHASDKYVTNASGDFQGNFTEGKGTFFGFPSTNKGDLTISGTTAGGIISYWSDVPAATANLQNLYLYKLVHTAIIKINPASDIVPADTITIQIPALAGLQTKVLTGLTIAANTLVAVDTVQDIIFTSFSFATKQYQNGFSIYRNNSRDYFGDPEPMGDEEEKTYTISLF